MELEEELGQVAPQQVPQGEELQEEVQLPQQVQQVVRPLEMPSLQVVVSILDRAGHLPPSHIGYRYRPLKDLPLGFPYCYHRRRG